MSTILLIDDEVFVLSMLQQMLSSYMECDVVTANSVDQALEVLPTVSVDLIVLDINMHGSSSLYFMEILQERAEWKSIPVVILSAMSFDHIQKAFLSRGAKAFFSKEEITLPEGRSEFLAKLKLLAG